MNGKPQSLVSQFKISYNLILNLIDIGNIEFLKFVRRSMVTGDLDKQMKEIENTINSINIEISNIKKVGANLNTPNNVIEEYIQLQDGKVSSVNKKRKEIERQIQNIQDNYKFIEQDKLTYQKIIFKENEINELQKEYNLVNSYIETDINKVLYILKEDGLVDAINKDATLKDSYSLTLQGKIASQLREIHCLVFARIIEEKIFDKLSPKQLVSIFSIFTNITVQEEFKDNFPKSQDIEIVKNVNLLTERYTQNKDKELKYNINTGIEYTIHYDLLNYVEEWCDCHDVESCKLLLQKMENQKGIFLGEFVKAVLKINNISCELEKVSEMTGNIAFLSNLREIPNITMKYVVTNQSLYI
jgi:superfamily II RNA helicase